MIKFSNIYAILFLLLIIIKSHENSIINKLEEVSIEKNVSLNNNVSSIDYNKTDINIEKINYEDKKSNDKSNLETPFFSRIYLIYISLINEIDPITIKLNSIFVSHFIEFHIIMKEKLLITYPVDVIIFCLIGYILCSIVLSQCCNSKNICRNKPLDDVKKLNSINKKYQDMLNSYKKKHFTTTPEPGLSLDNNSFNPSLHLGNINNKIKGIQQDLLKTLNTNQDFNNTILQSHEKLYDHVQKYQEHNQSMRIITEENTINNLIK